MAGVLPSDDNEPTSQKPVGLVSYGQGVLNTPQAPPAMRRFDDISSARSAIFGGIKSAASGIQPLTNKRHTLTLADVDWDDADETKPIKLQKQAILKGETLSRSLKGTLNLVDNESGKLLDSRRTDRKSTRLNSSHT